ncbi:MAG: hypothetical protein A2148_08620 [Chloroflexi bacterium RBG_16_68_14]|nr:MAG: hypothetical protein A2148_08620 [Chloroflexi bacterium RBG_16_68_14]
MTTQTAIRVRLVDDLGQLPEGYTLELDPANTPTDVQQHVIAEGKLRGSTPDGQRITYDLSHQGTKLVLDQPIGEQGVTEGSLLRVHNKNIQGC